MPTLPARAAAYTRTGILKRFLDQLALGVPARVDNAYAEARLGLKGGDVRAFLQSARVLGLVDPYGAVTDRARRTRAASQRPSAIREGLQEAYPELMERWEQHGGMARESVEDFFKLEYGLSVSSAGPAAKLFMDLMREYGPPTTFVPERAPEGRRSAGNVTAVPTAGSPASQSTEASPATMIDLLKSTLKVEINAEWDEDRINLVFDRMERLMKMVQESGAGESGAAVVPPRGSE